MSRTKSGQTVHQLGPTGCGKTETARQLAKTLGVELIRSMSPKRSIHSNLLIHLDIGYEDPNMGGMFR